MKLSKYLIPTLKEVPSDADTISAKLMLRAGMIRKVASGIYEWLPVGLRVLKKVESIIREEMNSVDGQEVWLPHIQPKSLWKETGRWAFYGKELLRIKDRKNNEFCFGPTAEEVITDLVRREVRSYRELPIMLYQFGTKFRDEIRPRFGVMRAREFYMKDAYSFHADEKCAEDYYSKVFEAYKKAFKRCGLKFREVEADPGTIGGSYSHEFMVLADTGEETMVSCGCGYGANIERAECKDESGDDGKEKPRELKDVPTPGAWTVDDVAKLLKEPKEKFIKTLFFLAGKDPVVALVRGDEELNESKLRRFLKCESLEKADNKTYEKIAGCEVGYAGPVGLKARIIADFGVKSITNGISGANKKDKHTININIGRDYKPETFADLRMIKEGDNCPKCGAKLIFSKGIEVGHTFKLGLKYSKSMDATFLDKEGKKRNFVMGCYGIGVSRIVAAAIEQSYDEFGIIWPKPIAPFNVILIPINYSDAKTKQTSDELYKELTEEGIGVLFDDRDVRAGVKFKDADLLGIPLRVTISEKKMAKGVIELKERASKDTIDIPVEKATEEIVSKVK